MKVKNYVLLSLFSLAASTQAMEEGIKKLKISDGEVALVSSDGKEFTLSQDAAEVSGTLKDLIKDVGIEKSIPLEKLSGSVLASVVPILEGVAQLSPEKREMLKADLSIKELKALPEWDKSEAILMGLHYLDVPYLGIVFTGKSGKEFFVALQVAKHLKKIKKSIEGRGIGEPISTEFSDATLAKLIALLKKLDPLISANEKAEAKNKIYIPRAYQPMVTTQVENLDNEQLGALFRAAYSLDAPFVFNALASVIADKIHDKVSLDEQAEGKTVRKSLDEQIAEIQTALVKDGFGEVPVGALRYILKHVTFRKCGINQEYSIADHLADYIKVDYFTRGLGNILGKYGNIYLNKEGLTSLFGIKVVPDLLKKYRDFDAHSVSLEENCFFDFDLDVQGVENPFSGLGALHQIFLQFNQLSRLPRDLFKGLDGFEILYLSNNQLSTLPEGIFKGLQMREIRFWDNPLSKEEKDRLKESLPGVKLRFS